MRKRVILAAGTMAGLVGVVLVVVAMLPPSPGVTRANFDRIEKGMTRAQVEAILGQKADGRMGVWDQLATTWTNDTAREQISIGFDENDLVEWTVVTFTDDRTLYQEFRDWLPWWRPEAA